jgi:hypothetical protein
MNNIYEMDGVLISRPPVQVRVGAPFMHLKMSNDVFYIKKLYGLTLLRL